MHGRVGTLASPIVEAPSYHSLMHILWYNKLTAKSILFFYLHLNWSRPLHLRGTGYALTASFMFGFGVVLAKLLSGELDAVLVAFLSLSIGGLLLTGFLLFTGNSFFHKLSVLNRTDWINIFLLSCIGTALPLLFIVAGFTEQTLWREDSFYNSTVSPR